MKLFSLLSLLFALAMGTAVHAAPLALHRGISVQDWLNWSPLDSDGTYRWPPYRSETEWMTLARPLSDWPQSDQFQRIRAMGFDFVRLSVDPGPLLASEGERREQALAVLERAVERVTSAGLKVVFDLHAARQVPAYSIDMIGRGANSPGVAQYRGMVRRVAAMLARFDAGLVALEPFNEPEYYPCDETDTGDWQRIMAATVADIRAISSDLTIIVTGACGGSITGLVDLDPSFDDPRLYYSFHMYEPHSFTHQLSNATQPFNSSLPWPAAIGSSDEAIAHLKSYMTAAGIGEGSRLRTLPRHVTRSPGILRRTGAFRNFRRVSMRRSIGRKAPDSDEPAVHGGIRLLRPSRRWTLGGARRRSVALPGGRPAGGGRTWYPLGRMGIQQSHGISLIAPWGRPFPMAECCMRWDCHSDRAAFAGACCSSFRWHANQSMIVPFPPLLRRGWSSVTSSFACAKQPHLCL